MYSLLMISKERVSGLTTLIHRPIDAEKSHIVSLHDGNPEKVTKYPSLRRQKHQNWEG